MGLIAFISNLAKGTQKSPFDPAVFQNPLAQKTSWTPKASGGASFKTRTLTKISSSELRYVGSTAGKLFATLFLLFPIVFVGIGVNTFMSEGFETRLLLFLLIPFVFMGVGFYLLRRAYKPYVLSKNADLFYKGKKTNTSSLNPTANKHSFKLSSIKALQIIPERIKGENSSYTSYELNFIFEDGDRYNLIDHGKLSAIEADAIIIADFLGVPLWNKMAGTVYNSQQHTETHSYNSLDRKHSVDSSEETTSASFSKKAHSTDPNSITEDLDAPYDSSKPRQM